MSSKLKGVFPAIPSPCDKKECFLEEEFAALAADLYQQGVHGLYVCGNTGDGYLMSLKDRKRAAELAVRVSREFNGKVIVHIGAPNTRDAVDLALHAAEWQVAAISSMPPVNRGFPQVYGYYKDIALAAGLPLLIYYIPVVTHHAFSFEEMLQLLDIEGVAGLKYTDWNLYHMKRLMMARPGITVFNGCDEIFCLGLLYGSDGGIGTTYNLFPRHFIGIYEAIQKNDIVRAMQLQNGLSSFFDFLYRNGLYPIFEYLLARHGYGQRIYRKPFLPLDPAVLKNIEPELHDRLETLNALVSEQK